MAAIKELMSYLHDDETVEGIVFGNWARGSAPKEPWDFVEPEPRNPVPENLRGKVLTLEQAKPYMTDWHFRRGYGVPTCYATYIWTSQRVIWVTQYDGSTRLDSAPRDPMDIIPDMPGGGELTGDQA